ncbi:MAG: arsenite methyltransferase, partial [Bacteroidia bacterium]
IPTEFAKIKKGDTVVDLGSGAGNDCFVARSVAGEEGKIIGVDFTEAMVQKAQENGKKLGYGNVEFRSGDIENVPIEDKQVDVVLSNCVMNLVPNKRKAFAEVFRILKPGGHFSISDIVLQGELPDDLKNQAEMYVGCVAGALQKKDYLNIIAEAGFQGITSQKERRIQIPDDILLKFVAEEELKTFKSGQTGIYSISVYGERPIEAVKS